MRLQSNHCWNTLHSVLRWMRCVGVCLRACDRPSLHCPPSLKRSLPISRGGGGGRGWLPRLPAPQSPEGLRPVCIQSLFILCTNLNAVMDTSWLFSPNSSMCAKRGIYRQGSANTHKQHYFNRITTFFTRDWELNQALLHHEIMILMFYFERKQSTT